MKILALDVSSVSTGVAIISGGKILKKHLALIITNPKKSYGERLTEFKTKIVELIKEHKPDCVAVEEVFKGRSLTAFKSLAKFQGVAVQTIYEQTGKDPVLLLAVSARSLLGLGSSKEDAFNSTNKKYKLGFDFEKDNDKVDAIVLGLAVQEMKKQGLDERSIRSSRRRTKRRTKRNKKSV